METMPIKVTYSTIDHFRQSRTFKTIEAARRFAQKWLGACPEISLNFNYATNGSGKITCNTSVLELFPEVYVDFLADEFEHSLD